MTSRATRFWAWGEASLLLACADRSDTDSFATTDAATSADASDAQVAAACGDRGEDIAWGAERISSDGNFSVTLLQSDPVPPRVGDNTWTLALRRAGEPLSNVELRVSSWMPDHAHGSLKAALDQEIEPGHHLVKPLSFQMPGLWQVTFAVEGDTDAARAVFTFCVTD